MTDSPFYPHIRPDRAVIAVSGEGALAFLHSLLTVDVMAKMPGDVAYGALLTPQGKILHDVFLHVREGQVLVDCAAEQAPALLQKLILYRLRAKLAIARVDDAHVIVGQGVADPRLPAMGLRGVGEARGLPVGDEGAYEACRLRLGLADSMVDIGSGELFVHEANLDLLGAVGFTKGCYVGQEVVSRTHHRGSARSRILPLNIDGPLPARGSLIMAGEARVGEVFSGLGQRALGLIRLDRLAEATSPLRAGDARVTAHQPDWMTL